MKYSGHLVYRSSTFKHASMVSILRFVSLLLTVLLIHGCSSTNSQVRSDSVKPEKKTVNSIQKLEVTEEKEITKITIYGTNVMDYTVFKLNDNPRIVVDIHNADLEKLVGTITVNNGTINDINNTQFDNTTGKVGRIEIGLDKMVDYEVVKEGQNLIAYIVKSFGAEAPVVTVQARGEVEKIDFRQVPGRAQVMVSTSSEAQFNLTRVSDDTLVLEVFGVEIPPRLQRTREIAEENSVVKRIKPYQTVISGKNTVMVDIILRAMVPYHVFQEGNSIYVDLDQPSEQLSKEIPKAPSPVPSEQNRKIQASAISTPLREEAEKEDSSADSDAKKGVGEKIYTGKKISMDFQDADIMNIFRLIADVSNLNIIAGDDVKGKITVRMVDVPWDQAFDIILSANDLGMIKEGTVARILPSERLFKEQQDLIGLNETKVQLQPLTSEIIPVNFAVAKDILSNVENKLSVRGKATADERTNAILITDIEDSLNSAKALIKGLDTPTPQVLIEARIVQINPTFTKEIGIQWGGSYGNSAGSGTYALTGEAAGGNIALNVPASAPLGGLGFGFLRGLDALDVRLTAMEKDEKVKIISRPRIVTLDNKRAKIEQGVDLPYLKLSDDGTTVTTEFKKATLSLEVTPHITPDGSVIMKVIAKKDQKSAQTGFGGTPGIDTRNAETEVLVKDGETTVIGGIYERTETNATSGIPFFSNIPVVGWLFKNKFKKDEVAELLIFITPTIVKEEPAA